MKITNEITPLEVNGSQVSVGDDTVLIVESHWNWDDRIYIIYGDLKLLVSSRDLEKAIANAKNHT